MATSAYAVMGIPVGLAILVPKFQTADYLTIFAGRHFSGTS